MAVNNCEVLMIPQGYYTVATEQVITLGAFELIHHHVLRI